MLKRNILIVVLVAISLSLRLYHLDFRGLITDEKFSLLTANGFWVGGANQEAFKKDYFTAADFWEPKTLQDYFDATAHADFGTHIIYNGLLHYWMKIFGNSDYSVRLPGVLFNVLTIVLIFLIVLKYFRNYWMAFFAALLFAVDPLNVAQSHIARSYTLSFLLIIISTEYFIRIIRGEGKTNINFIIYSILIALSLVNHYFNFFIPLVHGLIFLTLRNKNHLWKGFLLAAAFNLLVLVYWFNWGGGYTALGFMESKNEIHQQIANNSNDELSAVIQKATPDLIVKKAISLFYDITVLGHGLYSKINGVKNFIGSILLFITALIFFRKKSNSMVRAGAFLFIIAILAFNYQTILGVIISAGLFGVLFFGITELEKSYAVEDQKGAFILLAIGALMLILPILFVMNDANNSGNMIPLSHRYIGNASPFVVIFIAIGIIKMARKNILFIFIALFLLTFQTPSIIKEIRNYYHDESGSYAYFIPARVKNPYITAANKLQELAVPGDTIIIPGAYRNKYEERFEKDKVISNTDAQYLNLYLRKNFNIIQHIDKKEKEKLILKKADGRIIEIFDFKGEEYRY